MSEPSLKTAEANQDTDSVDITCPLDKIYKFNRSMIYDGLVTKHSVNVAENHTHSHRDMYTCTHTYIHETKKKVVILKKICMEKI